MRITEEIINDVKVYGRYNFSPQKMAVLLELTRIERNAFLAEFENEDSQLYIAWQLGIIEFEMSIQDELEKHIEAGNESTGEAAKALIYIRKKNESNDLRKELFGV